MLGDVNKLFVFKSLLIMPSNFLSLHLKETFPPIIQIFTEGDVDGNESRLPLKSFLLYKFQFSKKIDQWEQVLQAWLAYLSFFKLNDYFKKSGFEVSGEQNIPCREVKWIKSTKKHDLLKFSFSEKGTKMCAIVLMVLKLT